MEATGLRRHAQDVPHPRGFEGYGRMRSFLSDESGQGLVEYALIIALVSVVAIAALQLLGKSANNTLSTTSNAMTGN